MKNIKLINGMKFSILMILALAVFSCVDDDYDMGTINNPSDLSLNVDITGVSEEMPDGDGSGEVTFTANAEDAITYKFIYGDGFEDISSSGTVTHSFRGNGVNDYTVTVVASGAGGAMSSMSTEVSVFSSFDDPETKQLLTGGDTKTWYVAAAQPAHLGVGPVDGDVPSFYSAVPFEKDDSDGDNVSACFYTDILTFSLTANDEITYSLDNNEATFFNAAFNSDFGGGGPDDQCLPLDTSGEKNVSLSQATSGIARSTGTALNISGGGFMSYYIGTSSYEILSISENSMEVRAIPANDPGLAWYLKFTTTPYDQQGAADGGGEEEFETQFENLAWSDEFDGDMLDTDTWNYETGNGTNGWGNNEVQYYTEDNVSVQDGILQITARREAESGFDYTSARITTQDKYEFTYGRIEARAKMPAGGGTWPAIWMLGANFDEVGWPQTGEIDIMEWVGNNPDRTSSALHFPGNFGGNAVVGDSTIDNATSEFHIYTAEWTEDTITFLLDGEVFFTFDNDASKPFNKDFFLIMNVAMGGGLGGAIDPAFQESSMEVDYIRVYQ